MENNNVKILKSALFLHLKFFQAMMKIASLYGVIVPHCTFLCDQNYSVALYPNKRLRLKEFLLGSLNCNLSNSLIKKISFSCGSPSELVDKTLSHFNSQFDLHIKRLKQISFLPLVVTKLKGL